MQHSEQIELIAKAMIKIQKNLPAVGKDSKGYGYDYASLGEVISKLYPIMTTEGVCVSQILDESVSGGPAITTMLMHSSGQWLSGTYPLAEAGMKGVNSAQQFGAAITYARRYGLLAVIGVPVVDDDAACLSEPKKPAKSLPVDYSKDSKEKIIAMLESSGDYSQVVTLFKHYKDTAEKGGWYDEMLSICKIRKEELGVK